MVPFFILPGNKGGGMNEVSEGGGIERNIWSKLGPDKVSHD